MSSIKGQQYHEIPISIHGQEKVLKSVTKSTTCDDVINKLPKTGTPLAVFQTGNGEEKELKGKTKLLKVWRSCGSSMKSEFVVKPSEGRKSRRLSLNIGLFGGRNRRKSEPEPKDDKVKQPQVSDLTFYLQQQKSKLQKLTTAEDTSTSQVLRENPMNTRLVFKKTLKSKFSSASKMASGSSLKSADTGYQSETSDMRSQTPVKSQPPRTVLLEDVDGIPRHSTPVNLPSKRVTRDRTDVTLTATPTMPTFDENAGKSSLMERFMNDTMICESDSYTRDRNQKGLRRVYSREPIRFRSQEEKCRFYWNQSCESDDDSSYCDGDSRISEVDLDEAFVETRDSMDIFDVGQNSRKLRRESAVSNLNKFEVFGKEFDDICDGNEPLNTGFNYSFDCSFPEFSDTQDFSLVYSGSETESDLSVSYDDDYFRAVRDSDFYSFMKSRQSLTIHEKSRYCARDFGDKQSEVGLTKDLDLWAVTRSLMKMNCLSKLSLIINMCLIKKCMQS